MNEVLRRALLHSRLREDDLAAHLGVDPKTVRRWLGGRIPYPRYRAAIALLVGADEAELWPNAKGPLAARIRPDELGSIYPHRWTVPREVWTNFFASAQHEIDILSYSALFLAEDEGIRQILADKGRQGVRVRIALGDPDNFDSARLEGAGVPTRLFQPISAKRWRCSGRCPRASTSISGSIGLCCIAPSIVPTSSCSLTTSHMDFRLSSRPFSR